MKQEEDEEEEWKKEGERLPNLHRLPLESVWARRGGNELSSFFPPRLAIQVSY